MERCAVNTIDPTATVSSHARIYTTHLVVGKHCRIDDGVIITGYVEIGDYVHIGAYTVISGKHGVKIGDFTGIGMFVAIMTGSDDFSGSSMANPTVPCRFKPRLLTDPIVIGKNCLIGTHCTIMPGAIIRDGVGVGAHSLVKGECNADTLYGGIPAKKICDRSKDIWALTAQFEMENAA